MTSSNSLTIAQRFCGPPSSANGGWTAGLLAEHVVPVDAPWSPVTVQLRMPPPLDAPLDVVRDGGDGAAVTLTTADGGTVAVARAADHEPEAPQPVDADVARAAEARYAGLASHPFPTCFVCGTGRDEGDGLRVFPGRVDDDGEGRARVAATWTAPADEPSFPLGWAALDCVGGWAGDLAERLMVLGTMTASLLTLPEPGRTYVVVGGARGGEGRKTRTASALYAPDGTLAAAAEHVWIAIDPKDFA